MSQVATTPENLKRINAMVDSLAELLAQLWCRWQDEREYEDIAEYRAVIKAKLPKGFTMLTMSKRPFGFTFSIGTEAVYRVSVTARSYGWRRI